MFALFFRYRRIVRLNLIICVIYIFVILYNMCVIYILIYIRNVYISFYINLINYDTFFSRNIFHEKTKRRKR